MSNGNILIQNIKSNQINEIIPLQLMKGPLRRKLDNDSDFPPRDTALPDSS